MAGTISFGAALQSQRLKLPVNWKLWTGRDAVHIILGQSGYPVEVKGKEVRLLVDNDTGIWYQKVN